jgi:hypothetical protein
MSNPMSYAPLFACGFDFLHAIEKMDELIEVLKSNGNTPLTVKEIGVALYGPWYEKTCGGYGRKSAHIGHMLKALVDHGLVIRDEIDGPKMEVFGYHKVADEVPATLMDGRVIMIPNPDKKSEYQYGNKVITTRIKIYKWNWERN